MGAIARAAGDPGAFAERWLVEGAPAGIAHSCAEANALFPQPVVRMLLVGSTPSFDYIMRPSCLTEATEIEAPLRPRSYYRSLEQH